MLQSIPDPFDSYGPPQAEDQIFSILQPLSISVNAPSPSPRASPPETPRADDTIGGNAWVPSNGEYRTSVEGVSQWADMTFPSSPPPASSTPPRTASPPAAIVKSRQSHPHSTAHQSRKVGSKMKNVLPAVDESMQHADDSDLAVTASARSSSAPNGSGTQVPNTSWDSFSSAESPYDTFGGSAETTPQHSRHSSLFSPPSIPALEPDPPQSQTLQPDHIAQVPLPT